MKLSDIKGPTANAVNEYFFKVYENIIYEFNKKFDPLHFKIRLKATPAYCNWDKGKPLFEYTKELKEFITNEKCIKTEVQRVYFKNHEEYQHYIEDINQQDFYVEFEDNLFYAKGHTRVDFVDGSKYHCYYVSWWSEIEIKMIDRNLVLAAADEFIKEKNIKKKPLVDMRGVEYKVGDTVAYSDGNRAAVQLGLVTKLTDLRVEISKHINGNYIILKEPTDMLIVSPWIQKKDVEDAEIEDEVF